jgi:DNA-binding transcriptional MerR regulator
VPAASAGGDVAVVNAAFGRRPEPAATMSIGEVLGQLRPEFPDVTISKIRFLEDQGLIEPDRTPSGYRKFAHTDVDRLRYVLAVQRDHYLPLRVIRDHLAAVDAGLEPAPLPGGVPRLPRLVADGGDRTARVDVRLSRAELVESAAIADSLLAELESFGLVGSRPGGGYDGDALVVVRTAGELAGFGIEPRHLRTIRTAAEREAGLVEQVVAPLRHQRGGQSGARAEEVAREVASLCVRLHAALVKAAVDRLGP